MMPDGLLGAFEHHLADAAAGSQYKERFGKSARLFGGYNLLIVGHVYQRPPIPETVSLSISSQRKQRALEEDLMEEAGKSGKPSEAAALDAAGRGSGSRRRGEKQPSRTKK